MNETVVIVVSGLLFGGFVMHLLNKLNPQARHYCRHGIEHREHCWECLFAEVTDDDTET